MTPPYDSRADTLAHRELINTLLVKVASELLRRGFFHDESKLVDALDVDSDEYRDALKQMGTALQHHYRENRHHPEFHENGINGMTLVDLIEMVCDWKASAERKNETVNLEWARKRFGIDDQLAEIIANTLKTF